MREAHAKVKVCHFLQHSLQVFSFSLIHRHQIATEVLHNKLPSFSHRDGERCIWDTSLRGAVNRELVQQAGRAGTLSWDYHMTDTVLSNKLHKAILPIHSCMSAVMWLSHDYRKILIYSTTKCVCYTYVYSLCVETCLVFASIMTVECNYHVTHMWLPCDQLDCHAANMWSACDSHLVHSSFPSCTLHSRLRDWFLA